MNRTTIFECVQISSVNSSITSECTSVESVSLQIIKASSGRGPPNSPNGYAQTSKSGVELGLSMQLDKHKLIKQVQSSFRSSKDVIESRNIYRNNTSLRSSLPTERKSTPEDQTSMDCLQGGPRRSSAPGTTSTDDTLQHPARGAAPRGLSVSPPRGRGPRSAPGSPRRGSPARSSRSGPLQQHPQLGYAVNRPEFNIRSVKGAHGN